MTVEYTAWLPGRSTRGVDVREPRPERRASADLDVLQRDHLRARLRAKLDGRPMPPEPPALTAVRDQWRARAAATAWRPFEPAKRKTAAKTPPAGRARAGADHELRRQLLAAIEEKTERAKRSAPPVRQLLAAEALAELKHLDEMVKAGEV